MKLQQVPISSKLCDDDVINPVYWAMSEWFTEQEVEGREEPVLHQNGQVWAGFLNAVKLANRKGGMLIESIADRSRM